MTLAVAEALNPNKPNLETERSSGGFVLSTLSGSSPWLEATFDHLTAKDVLVLYHDSVANKTKRDFKL